MKAGEIRELSVDELAAKIDELEEEMFRLRLQHQLGQLENPLRLRHLRRDLARCRTIEREAARTAGEEGQDGR